MQNLRNLIVDLERFIQYGDLSTSYYVKRGLTIGKRFHRQSGCKLDPSHCWLIEIGDDVTLSNRVQILAHDDSPRTYIGYGKIGRVIIGDNVFVGAGAIILMNVRIGNNIIIGAGSVVTKDIPDNSVVAGVPAKVIGTTEEYMQQIYEDFKVNPTFDKSYSIYENIDKKKKAVMKKLLSQNYGFQELGPVKSLEISNSLIRALSSDNTPMVSVIVPIYNTSKYLKKCIESILAQTIKNIEIILVNDGSTDNSYSILTHYQKKDSRIKVINKPNGGLSSTRNAGLDVANGLFISFIDSDDYIGRDFLENLLSTAQKAEDIDIVIARLTLVDTVLHSNIIMPKCDKQSSIFYGAQKEENILLPLIGPSNRNKNNVDDYLQMCVWKNLYRKSFLDQYSLKFYSEREIMLEDFDFNIRAYLYARGIAICNTAEYYHLLVKGSLSKAYRPDRLTMELKLIQRTENFINYENNFLSSKETILTHFKNFIRKSCVGVIYNCSHITKDNSYKNIKDNIAFIINQPRYKSVYAEKFLLKDSFYYRFFCYLIYKKQITLLTHSMILSHILNYVYRFYIKVKAEGMPKWKKS
jgi:maltose O-acetyltransferase